VRWREREREVMTILTVIDTDETREARTEHQLDMGCLLGQLFILTTSFGHRISYPYPRLSASKDTSAA
jgi:hypothetical protein